jgi:hypothetical protein
MNNVEYEAFYEKMEDIYVRLTEIYRISPNQIDMNAIINEWKKIKDYIFNKNEGNAAIPNNYPAKDEVLACKQIVNNLGSAEKKLNALKYFKQHIAEMAAEESEELEALAEAAMAGGRRRHRKSRKRRTRKVRRTKRHRKY